MRQARFGLALLALGALTNSLFATDLAKLSRTIAKEPTYATKSPRYCLLVFGPEANARVWLVLDGDTAYLDRNGNGDLTEGEERIKLPAYEKVENSSLDGNRQHMIGSVTAWEGRRISITLMQLRPRAGHKPKTDEEAEIFKFLGDQPDGVVTGIIAADEPKNEKKDVFEGPMNAQVAMTDRDGVLAFSRQAKDAPIVHFHGPLTMSLHPMQKLVRGQENELKASVGTQGLGKGTFVATLYHGRIPDEAHPVAEVVFPQADASKPRRKVTVTLSKRC